MSDRKNPFEIDPDRLDREWLDQPKDARAAGVREADAQHALAQAKAALEVVAARKRLAVRKEPGAHGLRDKPTVEEVEAAVVVDPGYQDAQAAVNAAKFALDVAKADVTAFVDRRKALEALVDLAAMDYHTGRAPVARTAEGRTGSPRRADPGIDFDRS